VSSVNARLKSSRANMMQTFESVVKGRKTQCH
jgi:hypothetical protein